MTTTRLKRTEAATRARRAAAHARRVAHAVMLLKAAGYRVHPPALVTCEAHHALHREQPDCHHPRYPSDGERFDA